MNAKSLALINTAEWHEASAADAYRDGRDDDFTRHIVIAGWCRRKAGAL